MDGGKEFIPDSELIRLLDHQGRKENLPDVALRWVKASGVIYINLDDLIGFLKAMDRAVMYDHKQEAYRGLHRALIHFKRGL